MPVVRRFRGSRLNRLVAEVEQHLARPDTFVIHSLFFQAWGRR
jgi:hypothetical protein